LWAVSAKHLRGGIEKKFKLISRKIETLRTNLLEDVVLFGHDDQLKIGSTFLYHLYHLGVGFAHDRLSIDAHYLVTCEKIRKGIEIPISIDSKAFSIYYQWKVLL
jgi:hypothetical protein